MIRANVGITVHGHMWKEQPLPFRQPEMGCGIRYVWDFSNTEAGRQVPLQKCLLQALEMCTQI